MFTSVKDITSPPPTQPKTVEVATRAKGKVRRAVLTPLQYAQKLWERYKYTIFSLFWFIMGVSFVLFVSASDRALENTLCNALEITINENGENFFINKVGVQELMAGYLPNGALGMPVKQIDINGLEAFMESNPYVAEAETYLDMDGKLWVNVTQHEPLARVITLENKSYYISNDGQKMPVSDQTTARVPVITGHIVDNGKATGAVEDSSIIRSVYELTQYIHEHPFWQSQIEQIYIEKNQEIVLAPKLGDHLVLFGNIEDIQPKFDKLFAFYQQGLSKVGWEQYKTINLKYKNQIVCTKK